jgi:hypothetical protein
MSSTIAKSMLSDIVVEKVDEAEAPKPPGAWPASMGALAGMLKVGGC